MDGMLHQMDDEMPDSPEPSWKCRFCGEEFKSERIFNIHVENEHPEEVGW